MSQGNYLNNLMAHKLSYQLMFNPDHHDNEQYGLNDAINGAIYWFEKHHVRHDADSRHDGMVDK